MEIKKFAHEVHENAKAHGWWDEERSFGDLIALCHSELSEALEEYRDNIPGKKLHREPFSTYYSGGGYVVSDPTPVSQKMEGIPSELADVIIRVLDMSEHYGIDIEAVLKEKHDYNLTRPYKHGGKVM